MPTLESILADRPNRIAFEELGRALRRRGPRPIAMVGAGTSVRLGYPSWPGLLNRLDDEARAAARDQAPPPVRDYPDMLWRAQEYRRRIGDARFGGILHEIFKPTGRADAAPGPWCCSSSASGMPSPRTARSAWSSRSARARPPEPA